jgi:hypothetical protein
VRKGFGKYGNWAEMKEFEGKTPDGQMKGREIFKNMNTGEVAAPEDGWNGAPPCPTGILNTHVTDRYRHRYDEIRWDR